MKSMAYRWAPAAPLLVGASVAISAEVAIGILLYAGPGLMRSLTTVLAVEVAALGAGLWRTPHHGYPAVVDRLRRRWIFCLLAFIAAAVFGTSWSVVQDLGGGPLGQGLGLAVLAALPLYACGLVLGGMSAVAVDDPLGRLRGPGAPAALGAAAGFVLTGTLLPRAPTPGSLLVACLVLLSAGGLIYGVVLASRPTVHVLAERRSAGTHVRVEDRFRVQGQEAARYLLEGRHVRRHASLGEDDSLPWDVEVTRSMLLGRDGPSQILVVGGGASTVPRTILAEWPDARVDVLERNPAVVDLARDHFDTAPGDEPSRCSVRVGNLDDLLAEARGPYDLVVLDTTALAPLGGLEGLSRSARGALVEAVAGGGALVVGPLRADAVLTGADPTWLATELWRGPQAPGLEDEVVTITQRAGAVPPSTPIGDFVAKNGGPPGP